MKKIAIGDTVKVRLGKDGPVLDGVLERVGQSKDGWAMGTFETAKGRAYCAVREDELAA